MINHNEVDGNETKDEEETKSSNDLPQQEIQNEIQSEMQKDNNQIRSTIIPSLMKVVMDNKNDLSGEVQAFEIGRVVTGLNDNGLCNEEKSLGIIRSTRGTMQDALISLKEAVDYIFADIVKAHPRISSTSLVLGSFAFLKKQRTLM